MKYLIVAGGTVDEQFAVDIIKNGGYEVIIAVDAVMDFCYKSRIMPDVIVGDFDSVEQEALEFFLGQEQMDIHRLNPEKDDTDTEYALRFAIGRGATKITVLGGTGSRLDHVIGNVVLLGAGLEKNVSIENKNRTHYKNSMNKSSKSGGKSNTYNFGHMRNKIEQSKNSPDSNWKKKARQNRNKRIHKKRTCRGSKHKIFYKARNAKDESSCKPRNKPSQKSRKNYRNVH